MIPVEQQHDNIWFTLPPALSEANWKKFIHSPALV